METTMDIRQLDTNEIQRLFELYQEECRHQGVRADLKDFIIWLEER